MAIIFDCRTTYYTEIPTCWDEITVVIGLPPGDYVYEVTTPYGKKYTKAVHVEVQEDGFLILEQDFPDQLFNPWVGLFELKMYAEDGCTPVALVICESEYQSIIIQPVQVVNPLEQILLVCPCPGGEVEP